MEIFSLEDIRAIRSELASQGGRTPVYSQIGGWSLRHRQGNEMLPKLGDAGITATGQVQRRAFEHKDQGEDSDQVSRRNINSNWSEDVPPLEPFGSSEYGLIFDMDKQLEMVEYSKTLEGRECSVCSKTPPRKPYIVKVSSVPSALCYMNR
jgi:hypothetical protein